MNHSMIIYKIENKINGKIYIGQTKRNLSKRIGEHIRLNSRIGKSINKYGLQSFDVSVIDTADGLKTLNDKELFWVRFYDCQHPNGYNFTDGGEGVVGFKHSEEEIMKMRIAASGRKHSDETRKKMSISQTGHPRMSPESIEKNRLSNTGKKHSEETKKKMGDARRGRKHSEEAKRKISEGNKGKSRPDNVERNKKRGYQGKRTADGRFTREGINYGGSIYVEGQKE